MYFLSYGDEVVLKLRMSVDLDHSHCSGHADDHGHRSSHADVVKYYFVLVAKHGHDPSDTLGIVWSMRLRATPHLRPIPPPHLRQLKASKMNYAVVARLWHVACSTVHKRTPKLRHRVANCSSKSNIPLITKNPNTYSTSVMTLRK